MNVLALFKPITTFVLDVDGVLTDGTLQLLPGGEMSRRMNIKDGYAMQLAVKKGYRVVIISGGRSESVVSRLQGLGIKDIYTGITEKKEKLQDYVFENDLRWDEVLYMGDDIPDYMPMQMVGLPVCPADAAAEIKGISKYISPLPGGHGCVREVMEKVLKLNGHWLMDEGIASK
ncbi:3-deoxy-D-manno-octulosonate 8-phosphate phosphatase (KDO 8-P phosphatase) [Chitinophaga terrae (ex Kim and Jung 2007)]|jgi:3-deoxy-D-manno-octulosonate 8-phosphate phosphatase (KDO 8-P phosphatase)|uniref:3-deoxy-D-manno-octulosonate 8-phosphate phosphatase (KDO 8-P phosphatase) n=1 Tax=Chitinophaga terrae (ex Kim and Jung 2007) TaxID=408074 RepID=A0A1H4E256_9BACT|nr:3-deoxy-D-manno-octulosonate 8-phosphate phosphatase [Chitinophaga terrae (ex Kim and Jung 2007)]MDQ0108237.1 3-deoxy-D-manno-octulosonate 8-phosphate phosphatase (KDO 8-P phosphatase) [Chitinophaga terrae (ex Kim and Jung 2007)]GEP91458.1 3-deoxy-D-manno-octulosonate 8-phosphate phosphatase [Chitinophaga terrae (ex Kim and Jung 2007)]SEA78996.1 3-deoxy-D-manno-octulosonate 8-phosphate phosphatase (KDO 8-P phosphatase) [Chitinophaga terrae (ex Kim and Jung 2007)]